MFLMINWAIISNLLYLSEPPHPADIDPNDYEVYRKAMVGEVLIFYIIILNGRIWLKILKECSRSIVSYHVLSYYIIAYHITSYDDHIYHTISCYIM